MEAQKVGNLIRRLRSERNLTQRELGGLLGITDKTVSKWERGRGIPDISMIAGLAGLFEVGARDLLEGELPSAEPIGGNMKRLKFYRCEECGNILTATGGGEVYCCGRRLEPLAPGDAEGEHLPSKTSSDGEWYITLGHPMAKDHFLTFAALVDYDRVLMVKLYPEQDPAFRLPAGSRGTLYLGCSRHGLFKQKL